MASQDQVLDVLKTVLYSGFSKDIVSMGIVESVQAMPDSITISLKSISGTPESLSELGNEIRAVVGKIAGEAEVNVIMANDQNQGNSNDPNSGQDQPVFVRNKLTDVNAVIPVTSGKGGVGKSTVAVNIAHTLSKQGNKVGLLDLDIFGPSAHKMLGSNERLQVVDDLIQPVMAHGMKVVSIGMAVEDAEAMILRGPMVMKLLDQLINQVSWGVLDYLFVDLPPGTGDVPLSLTQQIAINGAVVVTTPQDVALIDVRRAVTMFKQTETHILGLVENMSHYVCEKCGDVAHIFGHGGGEKESNELGLPLLGQIPLSKTICEQADKGSPIFDKDKSPELAKIFDGLASTIANALVEAPTPKGPQISMEVGGGGGGG
ncbi:MAG TPA: Mrp/NBP35 family ATP-binding protein [Nitrospinota bacterium]|jgi:ATP-binding protein involved in chromosome partitioning|nr:Mrp/NBP35 family ATP-binding protein [Nitrospinota bacterium]|tara:strand:- start:42431 stop:43552 length:1122 start_codon:yes stop_codon:yes gene_type:complete